MANDQQASTREPFADNEPLKIDLKSYSVSGNGKCPPIYNLLVVGVGICLFYFGNAYFLNKIENVLDGSVTSIPTEYFSCQDYYCNDVANHFVNYYSYFEQCNVPNCAPVCLYYSCLDDNVNSNINLYYSCQKTKCGEWSENVPPEIHSSHAMTIASLCIFSFALIIGIIYGISSAFLTQNLLTLQKVALCLSIVWPSFKYYVFRRRQYWQNFQFNLKRMVIVDILIIALNVVCIGLCFGLKSNSFWQNTPETACFYSLIYASIKRAMVMADVTKPFLAAQNQIRQYRNSKII